LKTDPDWKPLPAGTPNVRKVLRLCLERDRPTSPRHRRRAHRLESPSDEPPAADRLRELEVIERLGLAGAFSFDRDFRDCGYRMLP
jgi:hypothetical protein